MAVRNEHGEVVATMVEKVPVPDSVFTLETLATRRAVMFVQELGLRNVVFKGDSTSSIQAISNRLFTHSSCGHIINDILLFVNSFQSFSFSHVCRQGNTLADALAKRVRLSCPFMVWKESVPLDLYNCYLSDFPLFNYVAFLDGFSKKKKKKKKPSSTIPPFKSIFMKKFKKILVFSI